ncbi:hypothetical protein LFAB_10150 [Lactiplantibacillus fabifermentans T30PCM01]|uniref:N-acetyltransferase domain-containing protein n=2 Tax=Lactiplantibacillus fabifermentans TaxID=483011 RepID=W6T7L5_9LACO|nr:hypothetical protein LFAB_10150 [Lactiplantibacillus fabifermentans T30PCM01]
MELHGKDIRIDTLKLVKSKITRHMCANFSCLPLNFESLELDTGKKFKLEETYNQISDYLLAAYDDQSNDAVTNVMYSDAEIIGYYTIQMNTTKVSKRYRKFHHLNGSSNNTGYPCVDVPFLAINRNYQQQGYGRLLIKQLLLNVHWQLVPLIGTSMITLDALNLSVEFYKKFGFIEYSPEQLSSILTPLALETTQLAQVLKINTGYETMMELALRKALESTLLFEIK